MIKRGLDHFSPVQVASIRIFAAALLLSPLSIPAIGKIKTRLWPPMLVVGALGSLFPAFLFATAQSQIPSSMAGILNGLTAVFALVVGGLFFNQGFQKNRLFGILLGFIGCGFLIFLRSDGQLGEFNFYALLIVLSTLCYGTSVNVVNRYFREYPAKVTSSVTLLSVAPFAIVLGLCSEVPQTIMGNPEAMPSLMAILFLGFFSTGIALLLFYKLLQLSNPIFGSSVTYLIPIVALIWGVADGEAMFFFYFVSMALILLGVYFISRR